MQTDFLSPATNGCRISGVAGSCVGVSAGWQIRLQHVAPDAGQNHFIENWLWILGLIGALLLVVHNLPSCGPQ